MVLSAVAILLSVYQMRRRESREDTKEISNTLAQHGARLVSLETKMELFWSFVQSELPSILHSPHTEELDSLLLKFAKKQTTAEEIVEMKRLLKVEWQVNPKSAQGFLYRLQIMGADARLIDLSRKDLVGSD